MGFREARSAVTWPQAQLRATESFVSSLRMPCSVSPGTFSAGRTLGSEHRHYCHAYEKPQKPNARAINKKSDQKQRLVSHAVVWKSPVGQQFDLACCQVEQRGNMAICSYGRLVTAPVPGRSWSTRISTWSCFRLQVAYSESCACSGGGVPFGAVTVITARLCWRCMQRVLPPMSPQSNCGLGTRWHGQQLDGDERQPSSRCAARNAEGSPQHRSVRHEPFRCRPTQVRRRATLRRSACNVITLAGARMRFLATCN